MSLNSSILCDNPRRQWQRRRRNICWFLAFAIGPILVAGCSNETRVPVFPVSGKVIFQGKPPVGAQVVLHPVNSSDNTGVAPSGTVKGDGSFAITSYDPDDGAPQGQYVATIEWYKITPEAGGAGPNVIPRNYANAKTSPIKVSVNSGSTDIRSITIK